MATCQCVPYFLPRATKTKVCGWDMDLCTANAKKNMEQINGNASSCHCLPGCYELSFTESKSNSDLSTKLDLMEDTIFVNVKDASENYIVKNMAVVHFYFTATKFTKQVKSQLYGFTEILSNVGGLLGLCMGFSFLSFVELIYFLSLKIVCKYVRAHRKQRRNREKNRYPYVR